MDVLFPASAVLPSGGEGHPGLRAQNPEVGPLAEPRGLRNGPAVPGINSLYNSFPSLKLANYNNQLVSDLGFRDLSGYSGFVCCYNSWKHVEDVIRKANYGLYAASLC